MRVQCAEAQQLNMCGFIGKRKEGSKPSPRGCSACMQAQLDAEPQRREPLRKPEVSKL